ncbi:putative disease resistance RPP13-like protein 1 [Corylus avellana]|uniref:putative disease resistance RPP13-like protein 1 n=1 Tax=Corylus avellana TaxID=13451 RepID=UPI00286BDF49|nr:putative disease resistance RPP13-like protein 1 [Corylus avellana]
MDELLVSSFKKVGEVLVAKAGEVVVTKVGEFIFSQLVESLSGRLAFPNIRHWIRGEGDQGLEAHLDKWRQTLQEIQKTHDDAEEKQYSDPDVKQWLDDLKHLVYDVDDIVDELATKASTAPENQARSRKFRKLNIGGASSSTNNIDSTLLSKITELTDRFNGIVTQKDKLKLKETADGRSHGKTEVRATTCLLTEPEHHIYGRDKDKKAILELLVGEKYCSDAQLSVIPILGMGGIGKTTLAQLVYNDEAVQKSFDLKAWACISQDFDVDKVTKTILQPLISENCDGKDLNWLQEKLQKKLKGKKFLVVLDDLWNDDDNDWRTLRAPFLAGARGSKIVITTRIERVPSKASIIQPYRLEVLSNDDCFSVFTQNALGASNFNEHPDLQDIGEKFVERCKGLPLAARTLGSLLRTKKEECDEWEKVLKSKIWDIPDLEKSGIVPALMLSYHHLPSHLKRCFMYCSILPEDYKFEEQELVLLWMAECLIQQPEGDKQMEDLGSEYFKDLLSRSFFQQSSMDKQRFVMHDLINDLARRVAGDICFKMEDEIQGGNRMRFPKKVRHSSYLGGKYDIAKKFEPFFELKCIRTFLPLPRPIDCHLAHNVPHQLLPKLLCLRALSLSGYCIVEVPDSIGDLKHLRYLDLSYTKIRGLPESTTTLCNLQTMILKGCSYLKKLPPNLGNLINLRHLNILNATKLEGMPPQIGKLTHLRTLSNLIVGKGSCFTLKELGSLLHLRGTLIISQLENVTEPRDASDAKLIEKTDLIALCLEWSNRLDESLDRTSEFEVLNMLQPHKTLKELTIKCYGGMKFPTWLAGHSFSHMVALTIENCKMCTSLPPVGQLQSLKHLFIKGTARVKNVGHEFYGVSCSQPFESLETLCFNNMEEWENWIPNQEFRNLHYKLKDPKG